jgi:uncharacterized protein (DUF433 family)
MANARLELNQGVYFASDISEILQLPYSNVRYWMNGFWFNVVSGKPRHRSVNFYTMMEFFVYYQLRKRHISSSKIKIFHTWASKEFDNQYPFASIKISTMKSEIFYEMAGFIIKGNKKKQPTISEFIEPHLTKIEFGDDSVAARYFPLGNLSKNVVVDPLHQFGQPVINGTNIQIVTLNKLYVAGETKVNICKLYDISEDMVEDAIKYYSTAKRA